MNEAERLGRFAEEAGIATSYVEIGGTRREVAPANLRAVLEALGYPTGEHGGDRIGAESSAAVVAPVTASFEPEPAAITLLPTAPETALEWSLSGEGVDFAGRAEATDLVHHQGRARLRLPPLVPGYYRVQLLAGARREETLLIRAPEKAWFPDAAGRCYGFSIQLYEQLGPGSIGLGDFGDLAGLAEAAGRLGAAALGLNPLHALFLSAPERASPYSPNSRLALNPLFLDVRRLPGLSGTERARLDEPAFAARVAALNARPLIDYPQTAAVKLEIARAAWSGFRARGGSDGFGAFVARTAPGITTWAHYETIAAVHGSDFHAWPAALRDRDGEAVKRFVGERRETCQFHLWLQWQAQRQLAAAARMAARSGMAIGLYHDLALGADPAGAEVWAGLRDFASALSVGAPPDPLNPRGQNWGFPPLVPRRLLACGLAPYIELVRANMRHAGALRIDHVLGLNRLFVIPQGESADAGTYLRYPLDALLAVVVLESVRARCVVIGEDLGTVPEGLRERLAARGILSLRLLYFERDEAGRPRRAEDYPREAVAAVGSHDLAPLAGYWRGEDLARMNRLDLWPTEEARAAAETARPSECAALRESFVRAGVAGAESEIPAAAAYQWLSRSPSRLVMIQPEDALDIVEPVNVPGTTEEPNWQRRRLPAWTEWLADPRLVEVVRAVQSERGAPVRPAASPPCATYRLQLRREFGFAAAARLVPYLAQLGPSHLYVSPIMASVPGSPHGYDVIDPARLDPDRGGETGFARLRTALARHRLQLVVDFVPNHLAAHPANAWWMDLLEWGLASRHAASFDVDWASGEGRLIVPFLGTPLERVLAQGKLRLACEAGGRFVVEYGDQRLPLAPASAAPLLRLASQPAPAGVARRLRILGRRLRRLPALPVAQQRSAGLALQAELADLSADERVAQGLDRACRLWARDGSRLQRLLAHQHWKLVYWRHGLEEINYRQFFDIADLAALRMERPAVFAAAHAGLRRLLAYGGLAGVRLDHVDGLAAPGRYLAALAALARVHGGGILLWVEKILGSDEPLCPWPVAGTTGYEFLNAVTRFFMPPSDCASLLRLWRNVTGDPGDFSETLARAKREVIEELFSPMLERVLAALQPRSPVSPERLRPALVEALVAFPVYRSYAAAPESMRAVQARCVTAAAAAASAVDPAAGEWLEQILGASQSEEMKLSGSLRDGVTRFWQLSTAVMAKGFEDTALYRDFSLLALNEVGGDPRVTYGAPQDLHDFLDRRARDWPLALNAGTTHDSKRGEDARLRLAMLAAEAERWSLLVAELKRAVASQRPGRLHPADEYFVWQTLLAVWPAPARKPPDLSEREELAARLRGYLAKALREGKQRSSWTAPDADYEKVVSDYAVALLDPQRSADFQRLFLPFAARLARAGALAALAALALRVAAPGVPDFYQGTEFWDLSLVDPDNRRPVDFGRRGATLNTLVEESADGAAGETARLHRLMRSWPDGRIKLYLIHRLLALRKRLADVFAVGGYRPLAVSGERAEEVLAFARGPVEGREAIVLIARVSSALMVRHGFGIAAEVWGDTRIAAEGPPRVWREALTGRQWTGNDIWLRELLSLLPAAVLVSEAI